MVFQVREGQLSVLAWQRATEPFAGSWALPGGSLRPGERLGTSASRHLAAKVDIPEIAHLEQLETRSDPLRDPRERVLATAYLALVTVGAQPRLPADTAWHPVDSLPACAFDHESIIRSARERLRAKLSYTNIGFALAPPVFTIAQLRDVYAAALGYELSATNLQRILRPPRGDRANLGAIAAVGGRGRPAVLYRFASSSLVVTNGSLPSAPATSDGPRPAFIPMPAHPGAKRRGANTAAVQHGIDSYMPMDGVDRPNRGHPFHDRNPRDHRTGQRNELHAEARQACICQRVEQPAPAVRNRRNRHRPPRPQGPPRGGPGHHGNPQVNPRQGVSLTESPVGPSTSPRVRLPRTWFPDHVYFPCNDNGNYTQIQACGRDYAR